VHDFRARALELLDDPHARDEALLLRLEVVDLLDLPVDDLDLGAQPVVARFLRADHRLEHQVEGEGDEKTHDRRTDKGNDKMPFAILALLLAPGQ
jgi:hypothetical protein